MRELWYQYDSQVSTNWARKPTNGDAMAVDILGRLLQRQRSARSRAARYIALHSRRSRPYLLSRSFTTLNRLSTLLSDSQNVGHPSPPQIPHVHLHQEKPICLAMANMYFFTKRWPGMAFLACLLDNVSQIHESHAMTRLHFSRSFS